MSVRLVKSQRGSTWFLEILRWVSQNLEMKAPRCRRQGIVHRAVQDAVFFLRYRKVCRLMLSSLAARLSLPPVSFKAASK